ncbi:MAG TPA: VTT domain-containing protein [Acetobacteraceae bacterium]|nr:VTT domain-containing protein [Acetobacteraceae bacterium]
MRRSFGLFARPVLLALGLVAAGLALRLLPGEAGREAAARVLAHEGAGGAAIFVLAGAALAAIGVPRQAVAFAGGYAFGVWQGAALALAAQLLGCGINFAWARLLARRWLLGRLRGRLARLDAVLGRQPFAATLTLRLLPVGNNLLLNLLAGASAIGAAPFLAGSAIGYLPQTVIFAMLGGGAKLGRLLQLGIAAALFAAAACLGLVLLRRHREAAAVGA